MGSMAVTMILLTFKLLILPFLLLLLSAVNCVRIRNFSIPDVAYVGQSAELVCDFELTEEGEELQYIHWYKGVPFTHDYMVIIKFDVNASETIIPGVNNDYDQAAGVNIDTIGSSHTSLILTDLALLSKGRYMCDIWTSIPSVTMYSKDWDGTRYWTSPEFKVTEYGCLNVTDQPEIVSEPPSSISSEDIERSTSTSTMQPSALENIVNEMKDMLEKTEERLKITEEALIEINTTLHTGPLYMFVCASHSSGFDYKQGPVTYGSLSYSSTNLETGGLNISSGVFTAGHPGIYSVSWSMVHYSRGPSQFVSLRKNGGTVSGSVTNTANQGRTMFVYLDKGDTLSLNCRARCDDIYGGTTLCISFVKSHEEPKTVLNNPKNPKWCDYE